MNLPFKLFIITTLIGCQPGSGPGAKGFQEDALGGRSPITRDLSPVSIDTSGGSLADGYEYTFASLSLKFQPRPGVKLPTKGYIKTSRFVSSPSLSLQSEEQVASAKGVCKDIELLDDEGKPLDGRLLTMNKSFRLTWRTHHTSQAMESWGEVGISFGEPSECILLVEMINPESSLSLFTEFSFAVSGDAQRLWGGVASSAPIDQEPLLLLDNELLGWVAVNRASTNTAEVTESPILLNKIPALNLTQVSATPKKVGSCKLFTHGKEVSATSETDEFENEYSLVTDVDVLATDALPATLNGGKSPVCEKVRLKANQEKSVRIAMNCAEYLDAWASSPDDGCRFALLLANRGDPINQVHVPLSEFRMQFDSVNIEQIGDAYDHFPQSAINPIREQKIALLGFDSQRLEALSKGFDLWLELLPSSFTDYFARKIKKITYVGEDCEFEGGGGYAYAGASEFFWCIGGAMSDVQIQKSEAPSYLAYIAVTAFHETLHTHGRVHDFTNPNYEPCKGTSQSAEIAKALTVCSSLYCRAFKDWGIQYYVNELNYSLKDDERRFQGVCASWNRDMGLTPASF